VGLERVAVLIIIASANSVNLTDGLDGLASGSAAFVAAAFVIISFWQGRHVGIYGVKPTRPSTRRWWRRRCSGLRRVPVVERRPGPDLHGRHRLAGPGRRAGRSGPAHPHPAAATDHGGLFVLETLSVVIQVISFRGFKRRVFRMAPIHHHFELAGWPEFTVIVRFWLIAGLFVAFGLGLFYADFIRIPGALD